MTRGLMSNPVVAQLRAGLRLIANEHITPTGRRMLESILDAHDHDESSPMCANGCWLMKTGEKS